MSDSNLYMYNSSDDTAPSPSTGITEASRARRQPVRADIIAELQQLEDEDRVQCRKQAQKKYRVRKKQKQANLAASLQNLARDLETTRLANRSLMDINKALIGLERNSAEMSAMISKAIAAIDLSSSRLLPDLTKSTLHQIVDMIYVHRQSPPDSMIPLFFKAPIECVMELEQDFYKRLSTLYQQYCVDYSRREEVSKIIELGVSARRRIIQFQYEYDPQGYYSVLQASIKPEGAPEWIKTRAAQSKVMERIHLSDAQRMAMEESWKTYCDAMVGIQQDLNHAHAVLDASARASQDKPQQHVELNMNVAAQRFTIVLQSTEQLQRARDRVLAALGHLLREIMFTFNAIQHTQLLLATAPYLPSPKQVCVEMLKLEPPREVGNSFPSICLAL